MTGVRLIIPLDKDSQSRHNTPMTILGQLHQPSGLERRLFEAGLVEQVSLADFYDVKARTSIQRAWQDRTVLHHQPNVHKPREWDDKLHASMRGEFFVEALQGSQRVLDIGCGEGWPSLYLARSCPSVTGVDLSPEHIALARRSAELLELDNVQFQVTQIEDLPFPDQAFDGVCFGGNVFTYGRDPVRMLAQIGRVLEPGRVFAFEQWPIDPNQPAFERILFFIDGGPPVVHYGAGVGLYDRAYFIYIKPETPEGRRLAELAGRMDGELSPEQETACWEIVEQIKDGALDLVERAVFAGESRSLAASELPPLLDQAGFSDVTSWALPDAVIFAQALHEQGLLNRLRQEDLVPVLRALVRSAGRKPNWVHTWVTCRKR